MPGRPTRKIAFFLLILSGYLSCLRADDLTTADGTVFKDAQVIRYETDGVVIRHAAGTNRVDWKSLPASARGRYQAEARKQKEEEIQKLKRDLARAEAEAARLKPDDGKPENPKRAPAEKSNEAAAGPQTGPSTTRPVSNLPALKPDEVVEVAELVRQFKDDPAGADQRYRKRKFRLTGIVERFEPKLFVRKYDVLLESPERFVRVVAVFDYPDDYRTVYTTQRGRTLVGKPAENKEVTLLQAGQTVVLQGTCQGARDTDIVFTGCRFIR
jgi:hypothetical protein